MDGTTAGILAGAAGVVGATVGAIGLLMRKAGRGNYRSPSHLHGNDRGLGVMERTSSMLGEIGHHFTGRGPRTK